MEALFKQYFWVLKALGISIAAALAASTVTTYFGTSYIYGVAETEEEAETGTGTGGEEDDDDDEKPAPLATVGATRGPSASERKKVADTILSLNLFCPTCTKIVTGPETPGGAPGKIDPVLDSEKMAGLVGKQPGEQACTLPLRLVATMETNMPEYSWATIRDEEDGSVGPYWPGDRIRPGVLLAKVERSIVHVNNEGSLQFIELGVEPPKPTAKPVAEKKKVEEEPKKDEFAQKAADAIKCESENSCTVNREFIDTLFANPAALTKQARVMPSIKDGETKGFKFYGIRPDSLPKLLGMKNGDLLTSVNGTELKSVDQVMGLITKLRRASNLQVTIERKGESITKDITIQ
jgi:type II secretion system protein C